jgi:hypothetical protein
VPQRSYKGQNRLLISGCLLPAVCCLVPGCRTPPPRPPDPDPATQKVEPTTQPEDGVEATGTYEGVLDAAALAPVFSARRLDLYGCYEAGKAKNRYLKGDVKIRFEITAAGAARELVVESSTMGDDAVERCLVDILSKLAYPKPKGGSVLAEYPLSIQPSALVPNVGEPMLEERAGYLARAKEALKACKGLPPGYAMAAWIDPDGKAKSAGFSSEEAVPDEARVCAVDALVKAKYPKSTRRATHLIFAVEELRAIKVGKSGQ